MGELYKLDFANGKSYIGITEKSSLDRFDGHRKSCRCGSKFPVYSAWRKYGEPKLIVLSVVENEDLARAEIFAIKIFGTLSPDGYNISEGGSLSPMRHKESKEKVSASMLKIWGDPSKAKRYSESMKGNSNRKGKPNSKEHCAKVSCALKGKKFTESHKEALRLAWIKRKEKGLGVPWNKGA